MLSAFCTTSFADIPFNLSDAHARPDLVSINVSSDCQGTGNDQEPAGDHLVSFKLDLSTAQKPSDLTDCNIPVADASLALHKSATRMVLAMQLTSLRFDNQTLRALPVEQVPDNPRHIEPVRQVKGACFSPIAPEPVRAPKLVAASTHCLALLGLSHQQV